MHWLKIATFSCFVVVIVVLAITSLLDVLTGCEGLSQYVYSSVPFIVLWALLALLAISYGISRHIWRQSATFLLHVAFLIILCGALTTHLFGTQGSIHIRTDKGSDYFITSDGDGVSMPFTVELDSFVVSYYPGTTSPSDFISYLHFSDGKDSVAGRVSMNKIFTYRHYRFYQAGYDPDGHGSRLSVAHDPYGIALTYSGYAILLLSMIIFFFQSDSRFRYLLRHKTAALVALFALFTSVVDGKNVPKVAPTDIANEVGDLYISYHGRISSVESYARDFCVKLCGSPSYRHRTASEVLCGWIFFPDTWKTEPMIKLKGQHVKDLLGTNNRYVSVVDFANDQGEYKLQDEMNEIYSGVKVKDASAIRAADEKISIINSLFTLSSLKLFPVQRTRGQVEWYSPVDDLPDDVPADQALFIRTSLDHLAEKIVMRRYSEARTILAEIRQYQEKECGEVLPSATTFRAEKVYNRLASSKPWAMLCLTIGILIFIYFTVCTVRRRLPSRKVVILLNVVAGVVWLYLSLCISLRAIIGHHIPLSDGFETMQALAWCCLLITLFLQRHVPMALPFGFLVGGLTLLVAMMGESNPAVTPLLPVLHSPLLSAHVMVIMVSYALLAFICLSGITAMVYSLLKKEMTSEVERLRRLSELMLYPAVFLLAIGIFIGAMWANVSWGRYWGWDSKEVWALITLMVYALPLHSQSIAWFRSSLHFHTYVALAFLAVLMTYFGANYLLPGLHAYV